ncbi:MAG: class I SAM-dependent methyltransferase [Bacteroidetes bacterium]|nr:class I SAM-dependent methyltransferase [Bacteroidota bacterium]
MKVCQLVTGFILIALFAFVACKSETDTSGQQGIIQNNNTSDQEDDPEGFFDDYENTNRRIWQKTNLIISLLGNLEGKTVADIGAGTGHFARRLVQKADKVIAIDIDQRFVNILDSIKYHQIPEVYRDRLETRLGKPDDPRLEPAEAHIVLIVNTYMFIQNRENYIRNLKRGIADGGRIIIVDFKKRLTPIGPISDIRVPLYQVEQELHNAGYINITSNDTALDYQYIVMAEKDI